MKRWWVGTLVAALLLTPPAFDARPAGSATPAPPVSQPLVREGDFAVGLARGLVNDSIAEENEAESELASLGIAPRNGWISDYPVTPDILGELKESVAGMADSGKLSVSGYEASAVVDSVGSSMGLYVQTARGIDTAGGRRPRHRRTKRVPRSPASRSKTTMPATALRS